MRFRVICSLLVVLVCAGGYFALDRTQETAPGVSDDFTAVSQPVAPAAPSSPDDSAMKDLKVN